MIKPPCGAHGTDCPKRTLGCHADCPNYLEWAKQKRQERIHTNNEKKRLDYMWDYNGKGRRKK